MFICVDCLVKHLVIAVKKSLQQQHKATACRNEAQNDAVDVVCLIVRAFFQLKVTVNVSRIQDGPKSRPPRLKAHIFCLYLQNAQTNFHNFWHNSTLFYCEYTIHSMFLNLIIQSGATWRKLITRTSL